MGVPRLDGHGVVARQLCASRHGGALFRCAKGFALQFQQPPQPTSHNLLTAQLRWPAKHSPSHVAFVDMGNPHAVIFLESPSEPPALVATEPADAAAPDSMSQMDIAEPARALQTLKECFPHSLNVEFVQILSTTSCKLRVFERGAGETMACGTGACAAAVASVALGHAAKDKPIRVEMPGGTLKIQWSGAQAASVHMFGPATFSFHGAVSIPPLSPLPLLPSS